MPKIREYTYEKETVYQGESRKEAEKILNELYDDWTFENDGYGSGKYYATVDGERSEVGGKYLMGGGYIYVVSKYHKEPTTEEEKEDIYYDDLLEEAWKYIGEAYREDSLAYDSAQNFNRNYELTVKEYEYAEDGKPILVRQERFFAEANGKVVRVEMETHYGDTMIEAGTDFIGSVVGRYEYLDEIIDDLLEDHKIFDITKEMVYDKVVEDVAERLSEEIRDTFDMRPTKNGWFKQEDFIFDEEKEISSLIELKRKEARP